ncbi:hypothetical protein GOP47_0011893 [Adiantum capillus-veneris]|uniref:Transmembrane protein n=1 Tax=Adiantum capillus-veneris TaxID=13818 RepID=A0A9D4UU61_ADICA|nr:hypothetical protein GOP47_0011893 [Adiantum capillus-veneris]
MACCYAGPSSASSPVLPNVLQMSSFIGDDHDDDGIVFEKRSSNLPSIFTSENHEHRVTLEDWTKQYESSERHLVRKQANCSSARSDLYQILGLFFVFQGVVLTAVAQANQLRCHNWILPFFLCLLTSLAAFGACLQKLKEISELTEQHRLERAHYVSLRRSIENLKQEGVSFDVRKGQPELKGPYTEAESSGRGSIDNVCSSFSHFCSVWILSYAGAVLLLLCVFSALTLFSVHQILCNPGK